MDRVVVDIGPKERLGLTFVALYRTRKLFDLAFNPMFSFERLQNIGKCIGLKGRSDEENRWHQILKNIAMYFFDCIIKDIRELYSQVGVKV